MPRSVDNCVEALCKKGCASVSRAIESLERGERLPETWGLTSREIKAVVAELKSVMAVYGDRCRVDS